MLAAVLVVPQAMAEPGDVRVLIEIPAGSAIKYELDEASGRMEVDRFISSPVAYPANYGIIPETLAADGDALDVLVYTRAPIHPGALIRVRPIGVLRMRDGGQGDDKIVAVPASAVDPTYDSIKDYSDLPEIERQRLVTFFSIYKLLPDGSSQVELLGTEGAEAALESVDAARRGWAGQAPD
ncbi:inorganic diphosphatase [Parasphingorhabdus sp.]|uniref:inorganic diphosphatase n=1 Tax=Parasphingorhabdus sp. TaxID=2709688 RepID=UPI003593B0F9